MKFFYEMLQDIATPFHIFALCNGIYELRVEYNSNIYRVFFIFEEDYIVVLFNGFQKKGQKTPESEIAKALKIKEEYYEYKRRNGSGL